MADGFGKSEGFRRFKLALKRLIGREPRLSIDLQLPMQKVGVWNIYPDILPREGIVYSLGVGEDIGLDLELVKQKNMEIHAFDPTPNSVDWLKQQNLPARFHFHPWAVADKDGSFYLYPRVLRDGNLSSKMYTLLPDSANREDGVEVPAKTIATILQTLGHDRIDLLKMDIEGAEYGVLEGLLASPVRPDQLLIEFHHRHAGLDKSQTLAAVAALRAAGYGLADISCTGREFNFILKSKLGGINGK